jgi:Ran GTPase-activating protein (RanGAP) involved in mRNA processing and transport
MTHTATFKLLRLLKQKSKLRTFALVDAKFDTKNERELIDYLKKNTTLLELDLSWNNMSQQAYIDILKCVVENNNLLTLNLAHNTLIHDPKTFTSETEESKAIKTDKM